MTPYKPPAEAGGSPGTKTNPVAYAQGLYEPNTSPRREPGDRPHGDGGAAPASDVEMFDVERVPLDEVAAGFHLLSHQHAEQVVGRGGVVHRHP